MPNVILRKVYIPVLSRMVLNDSFKIPKPQSYKDRELLASVARTSLRTKVSMDHWKENIYSR